MSTINKSTVAPEKHQTLEFRIRFLLLLGIPLVALISSAIGRPEVVFYFVAITFPLYLAFLIVFSLVTGYIPGKSISNGFNRDSNPLLYWLLIGIATLMFAGSLAWSFWILAFKNIAG